MNLIKKCNAIFFVLFFVLSVRAAASPSFGEEVYDDVADSGFAGACLPVDLPDETTISASSWSTTAAFLYMKRQNEAALAKTNPGLLMGTREAFLAFKEANERALRIGDNYNNNERDLLSDGEGTSSPYRDFFPGDEGGDPDSHKQKKLHPMPLPIPYPIIRQTEEFPERISNPEAGADCRRFDDSRPEQRAAAWAEWLREAREEQERRMSLPLSQLEY